jgi:hypothetical protein
MKKKLICDNICLKKNKKLKLSRFIEIH